MASNIKPLKLIVAESCKDTQDHIRGTLDKHYGSDYKLALFGNGSDAILNITKYFLGEDIFEEYAPGTDVLGKDFFQEKRCDLVILDQELSEKFSGSYIMNIIEAFRSYEGNKIIYSSNPNSISVSEIENVSNLHIMDKSYFMRNIVEVVEKYRFDHSKDLESQNLTPVNTLIHDDRYTSKSQQALNSRELLSKDNSNHLNQISPNPFKVDDSKSSYKNPVVDHTDVTHKKHYRRNQ